MNDVKRKYLLEFTDGFKIVSEVYSSVADALLRKHELEDTGYTVEFYICRKVW